MQMIQTSNKKFNDWLNEKISEYGPVHWTATGVDLVLDNPEDNPTVRYEKLVGFFDSLKVAHLGEGNLQKIFDMGFETPELVIELTVEDLGSILGSKIIAKKVWQGLREKLTNIPMYQLMGAHPAFGRGVGVRKMKKLYDAFKGDMSKCSSISWITKVDGFDTKTATKIQKGYEPFMSFLINIKPFVTIQEYEAPKEGNLTGKIVVFTGFRNSELEKAIENAGGKMGSSVSGKTSYVVTPTPDASTGKLDAARAKGIKVIDIEELKEML
jgi:NAD-dependent DNA ligase